jgi:hypothetical protein
MSQSPLTYAAINIHSSMQVLTPHPRTPGLQGKWWGDGELGKRMRRSGVGSWGTELSARAFLSSLGAVDTLPPLPQASPSYATIDMHIAQVLTHNPRLRSLCRKKSNRYGDAGEEDEEKRSDESAVESQLQNSCDKNALAHRRPTELDALHPHSQRWMTASILMQASRYKLCGYVCRSCHFSSTLDITSVFNLSLSLSLSCQGGKAEPETGKLTV